jgi:tetratricopeptide (TPR) repeat protein
MPLGFDMLDSSHTSPAPPPTSWPWPLAPTIGFFVMLASLTTIAVVSLVTPARILTGLPDDPDVREARAALGGTLVVNSGGMRFASSLGGETAAAARTPADPAALARAASLLERAQRRHGGDPRLLAALAHLDLAAGRLERAERRYRAAIDRIASYGEARLGLGVTLERRARRGDDPEVQRGLLLAAIAQFAAVPEKDPQYALALHNRVLLLREVGRPAEAERLLAHAR